MSTSTWGSPYGTTADLYAVACLPDRPAYAVGAAGTILRRGGDGWSPENSCTSSDLLGVNFYEYSPDQFRSSVVVAVGTNGTILRGIMPYRP